MEILLPTPHPQELYVPRSTYFSDLRFCRLAGGKLLQASSTASTNVRLQWIHSSAGHCLIQWDLIELMQTVLQCNPQETVILKGIHKLHLQQNQRPPLLKYNFPEVKDLKTACGLFYSILPKWLAFSHKYIWETVDNPQLWMLLSVSAHVSTASFCNFAFFPKISGKSMYDTVVGQGIPERLWAYVTSPASAWMIKLHHFLVWRSESGSNITGPQ